MFGVYICYPIFGLRYSSPPFAMRTISFIIMCYFLAACSGNPSQAATDYALAMAHMHGSGVAKDEEKGLSYLTRAAKAGNADAELAMGYFSLKGNGGMKQDETKAVEYFTKSAEHGNRDAQYNVGLAYARGQGVLKDFKKAYGWFEKAAYQNDAGAQYNLGVMTINGEGVTADPLTAYVWFRLAKENAYDGAEEGMESAKAALTEDQMEEAEQAYAEISQKITKKAQPKSEGNPPL